MEDLEESPGFGQTELQPFGRDGIPLSNLAFQIYRDFPIPEKVWLGYATGLLPLSTSAVYRWVPWDLSVLMSECSQGNLGRFKIADSPPLMLESYPSRHTH